MRIGFQQKMILLILLSRDRIPIESQSFSSIMGGALIAQDKTTHSDVITNRKKIRPSFSRSIRTLEKNGLIVNAYPRIRGGMWVLTDKGRTKARLIRQQTEVLARKIGILLFAAGRRH